MASHAGLIWTLVRTDFKVRYHGTFEGFVWALLKPLAMFVVLLLVFSFLFPEPAYKLNLIIGLFLWDFFAEGTKTGLTALHDRGFLLTKSRCPSWILVITSVSNALITLVVFVVIFGVFLTFDNRLPSAYALLLFAAYCIALVVSVVGFSLAASVLFLRYRDLNQIWDVVAQAGFFLAPIVFPLGIIPKRYHFYFYLWPPTPIIEFSHAVLVNGVTPTRTAHAYLTLDAMFILVTGTLVFRALAPRAAEYV
jgi:lipopolysaccharide transport system permease protein